MPIDYSKWDNLDVSSSDEDENDRADQTDDSMTPRVTRLDTPSKITFGGKSSSIVATPTSNTQTGSKRNATKPKVIEKINPTASWTNKGGVVEVAVAGKPRKLYWSQDRYSVTLRLDLDDGEKVSSVCVEGILPYGERFSAVGTVKPRLRCKFKDGAILLEGSLPHPVHLAEEDEDADWTVENGLFLVITLQKAVPMQGLSLWWRRPLMEVPEINLERVRGNDSLSSSGTSKEFLEAWEQAHKLFREKKHSKQTLPS